MHKDGKWARQIIDMQDEERMWGSFHSLSSSNATIYSPLPISSS